jgi:hypothetical protein
MHCIVNNDKAWVLEAPADCPQEVTHSPAVRQPPRSQAGANWSCCSVYVILLTV